jgi:transcriptional regulator with XRE-family HTH domain
LAGLEAGLGHPVRLHRHRDLGEVLPFLGLTPPPYSSYCPQELMIHRALKLLRTFNDLSQKELAEQISLSNSYISELESGKKPPTVDVVRRYGEYFRLRPSAIMFFSEEIEGEERRGGQKVLARTALSILEKIEEWGGEGQFTS